MYLDLICWVTHAPVFFLLFPPLNTHLFNHVEFLICHYELQPKIGMVGILLQKNQKLTVGCSLLGP